MKIEKKITLPPTHGQIVEDYLIFLKTDKDYPAFTITDEGEIIEVIGTIENNGRFHYHFNIDNSEDELYIRKTDLAKIEKRWWTTKYQVAVTIREKVLQEWKQILQQEIEKIQHD